MVAIMNSSWYFSFGVGQTYRGFYVEIIAKSEPDARQTMIEAHATNWSMSYDADEFPSHIKRFNLKKLATIKQFRGDDTPFYAVRPGIDT